MQLEACQSRRFKSCKKDLTSTVFNEPNKDSSCWISTISLFHALRTVRSCASNQAGLLRLLLRVSFSGSLGGRTGSSGTDFKRSGVMPKWISNSAEGRHGSERVARLRIPFQQQPLSMSSVQRTKNKVERTCAPCLFYGIPHWQTAQDVLLFLVFVCRRQGILEAHKIVQAASLASELRLGFFGFGSS